jgi:hypothetical protein
MSAARPAFFHHGSAWVAGVLDIDFKIPDPRFSFVATDKRQLPQGPRIRTVGRVDGLAVKAKLGSLTDRTGYRPPPEHHIVLISDTRPREGMEPHYRVFAVGDPSGVVADIKAHRDAQ